MENSKAPRAKAVTDWASALRRIVEKYAGAAKITNADELFTVSVMMFM
jgi:hypothetical protein